MKSPRIDPEKDLKAIDIMEKNMFITPEDAAKRRAAVLKDLKPKGIE